MAFVLTFLLRRLSQGIVIVLLVGFVIFSLLRIVPGDPVRIMVGPMATEEQVEQIAEELGLRDPLPVQFGRYLSDLARGDLGNSFIKATSGASVAGGRDDGSAARAQVLDLIVAAIPFSALLAGLGVLLALIFSIPLGIAAGLYPNGWIGRATFAISSVFVSLPNIWLGILLILIISVQLGWLPAIGYKGVAYAVLPAIVLAVELSAVIVRALASSVAATMQENFVQAGIVRGLTMRHMITHHVLRNSAIPMLNLFGAQLGGLLLGSLFVVEYIFNYPGLGLLTVNAVFQRDFPVIQGVAILTTAVLVLINILVDLISAGIDRRLQY
ncbi:MAG: ABC transporter permease [Roseitalea sp.]|jgi:peptide/nickel transport system permease protein|nr:ABC transporter permease [Roseitalea sp.]MBO6720586.1 ABC transporter permease [Roseitalea sp.]MBO6743733.1 ABC transporter permease [Roseitalea sp.]